MRPASAFLRRVLGLFRKRRHEASMADEMQAHLDGLTERNITAGMSPEEARFAALRAFGGVEQIKERARDQRGIPWLEQLLQDVRYGARQLRRAPGFTTVALLTLALGIGAVTTIFSIVNSVILRPLDYPDSDRLVVVRETYPPDHRLAPASWGAYYYWTEHAACFSSVAASRYDSANLTGVGDPQRATLLQVTPNYFSTLGLSLSLGRGFRPDEATPGHDNVAVLSHWFWLKNFSGRVDVIGQTILLNDRAFTIIGVMPPNERIDQMAHFFVPFAATAADRENYSANRSPDTVIARLKPGLTLAQAAAEMTVVSHALADEQPATNQGRGAQLTPLLDDILTNSGYMLKGVPALLSTLLGAVGFLLLIACVNIANLLLARASTRRKEIALRAALGASRGRIVRQLLCESLLLAALGGGLGLLLGYWSLDLIKPLTSTLPRASEISLDGRALAFNIIVIVLTGLAFGLVPAWQAARGDLLDGIKDGGQTTGEGRRPRRLRSALVVAEVALALILLIGAGLMINSFIRLQRVDLGFRTDGIFANRLELPAKKYGTAEQQTAFVEQLTERVAHLPDVNSVAFTSGMPIFGSFGGAFKIDGRPDERREWIPGANYAAITPEYFQTVGIPLLRGRAFTPRDTANALRVAIISETIARKYFPNVNPIGQRIARVTRDSTPVAWLEIVGVVGDVKQWGPASDVLVRSTPGNVYEPFAQNPTVRNLLFVVHTPASTADLPVALRSVIRSMDPDMPLTEMFRLSDGVAASIAKFRLSMYLFGFFAAVALLLAMIGIYGVMAYTVSQRTHEIGVRMSLGAQRAHILRLILGHAGKRVGIGLLVGLAAALALSRLLRSLLFEVSTQDPVTLSLVALLLAGVALLACWLPARRATQVDPMTALREE